MPAPTCLSIHDNAVRLAPTATARAHAYNARAAAINAADEAEYQADPAGYRLRQNPHDAALAREPNYFRHC